MNAIDAIILHFQETRRRSILAWRALPDEWLGWRPDKEAYSFGEMIRHVCTATFEYHQILLHNGSAHAAIPDAPYKEEPIVSVEREIALGTPLFEAFLAYIRTLDEDELDTRIIDRSDVGYQRPLGDMLLRIAYHDAVHTGQFLQYMRMAGLERPLIWD
ncbi:DinB family protein [Brevibacillus sp. SYP-B805]|uniref:DinB family protein n=1 Tax=Brevibacillus sp. SYP-B805 TaxID=1578199 RepID=UPI0013EC069B|nr:DinB family protein [Brevibacillus sp. SYP-B805]NGQ97233.1 DinB family protein [Brevibacillus sp. SYP-B805]